MDQLRSGLDLALHIGEKVAGASIAEQVALAQDRRFMFSVLDAQAIPFPESCFDVVVGNGLLDHVPDCQRALQEIQRVLKPEGKFYTSTGGCEHFKELNELVRPFLPEKDFGGDPDRFGLENGEAILARWFARTRRTDYRSTLEFDRARPILEYILSEGDVKDELTGAALERFKSFLDEELASRGNVRLTAEKGVIEAVKYWL